MKTNTKNSATVISRWTRFFGAMLTVAFMMPAVSLAVGNPQPSPVVLGTAANYRILAGSAITVNGTCTVTGDIGLSPTGGAAITGAGIVTGIKHSTDGLGVGTTLDATLTSTKTALDNAYTDISTRTADDATQGVDLSGKNLGRGIYSSGTFSITGTLTLTGTASDIFIFQSAATLTTGSGSHVTLVGVLPSNVFWLVTSSATLDGDFKGIIVALTNITQTAGTVDGRLLARNGFVTVSGTTVLPVELVAFTATANRMNTNLHWSTATEVNNYGFEIERRQTSDWAKVGFVTGAGTSNSPRDYSYSDNNLPAGRYTYRLKQVDNNGAFSYHGSTEVEIGLAPQVFALSQNYPNPFNPSTQIQYSLANAAQVSLKVYNVLGVEVASLVNSRQEAGSYTVPFSAIGGNTSTLASGVYIYRLEAGSFVSTKKLVLMK